MIDRDLSDQDRRACYLWSVVPALMAWASYILSPIAAALVLVLGFILQYWRDMTLVRKLVWPSWYLPMRIRLTAVASLSLLVGSVVPLVR